MPLKLKQASKQKKQSSVSLLLLTGLCCFVSAAGFVFGVFVRSTAGVHLTFQRTERIYYWC
jgi:accessory gene regulator protein AgrB